MATIIPVKQHIMLLDKPIWTPSRTIAKLDYYTDDNGFEITTDSTLPTMFDRFILGDLMKESQRRENAKVLQFDSMNALMKTVKLTSSGKAIKMVEDSLKRWAGVSLSFASPIEYDTKDDRKAVSVFKIMRHATVTKNGGIRIRFTDKFTELNQDRYTRRLDMDLLKHIGRDISPFALRLYEVVSIFTYNNKRFVIGLEKLYKKLAVSYSRRRHSEAFEQLGKAVNLLTQVNDELQNLQAYYGDEKRDVGFTNIVSSEKKSRDKDKEQQESLDSLLKWYNTGDMFKKQ
jgi:hypothetical protein